MLSAVTVLSLVLFRPRALSFSTGEEIALAGAWALALVVASWLFLSSACCAIALRRGRLEAARRCAAFVPKVLRRGLELAIVATIAGSALPAHALTDEPVVRTPHVASTPSTRDAPTTHAPTPSTTAAARPSTTTASTPATTNPPSTPTSTSTTVPTPALEAPKPTPPRPSSDRRSPAPTPGRATYVVQPGDNLWLIARRSLEERDRPARELVAYWHAVIEANASTLRSGDPNLIYPGEVLVLPPVS